MRSIVALGETAGMLRDRMRAPRRIVELLFALLTLVVLGGIPGAPFFAARYDRVAKAVPHPASSTSAETKAATLEIAILGSEHPVVARVRAYRVQKGVAELVADTKTDAGGHALLHSGAGEHWILADADGFSRSSAMVLLVPGTRHLDLAMSPEHVLAVRVNDERGEAIGAAEVECVGGDPVPVGARTDEKGLATLHRLGVAPWVVRVRAPGFGEIERRGIVEGQELVIVLHKLGSLHVIVLGEGERPESGATVQISSATLWPSRRSETGKDGSVSIAGLAEGAYALRASKGGHASETELAVSLERGAEKEVTLRLRQGALLAVRVVEGDTDRTPVRGAEVILAEGGLSAFPIEGTTGKDGKVVLGPVSPTTAVIVTARGLGWVSKSVSVDPSVSASVEIALARAGTVEGRVVDSRGFPVAGATLVVVGTDFQGGPVDDDPRRDGFRSSHFQSALAGSVPLVPAGELGVMPGPVPPIPHTAFREPLSTGALAVEGPSHPPWVTKGDGTFELSPVSPGRVRVVVRHPEFVEAESEIISLAPGMKARVEVEMHGGGSLEGHVVDARGRPVPHARVTLLATRGSMERSIRAGTDGSFAFASVPSELTLLVARGDDPLQIDARVEVTIPEGKSKEITVTLPEARPPLLVVVTDDREYPLSNVQISVVSLDPSSQLRATVFTDSRGEAQVPGARGILLSLEVRAPGHATTKMRVSGGLERALVRLVPGESLRGEVRDAHGRPVGAADVSISADIGVRHVRTDKKGLFAASDVAPGRVTIVVNAEGFASATRSADVGATNGRRGTDVPVFELEDEAVVEGTVVDAKGDPIAGARVAKDSVPVFLASGAGARSFASDAKGRFRLGSLPEGEIVVEVYVPDVGRTQVRGVHVRRGRSTDLGKIVVSGDKESRKGAASRGGVAITLGETGGDVHDVVVVHVAEGSEAERAGLAPGDLLSEVGGRAVHAIEEARGLLGGAVGDDVLVRVKRGELSLVVRIAREEVRR